jgi:hypothetical protein
MTDKTQLEQLRDVFDELGIVYRFLDWEHPDRASAGMDEESIAKRLKILRIDSGGMPGSPFADFTFSTDGRYERSGLYP